MSETESPVNKLIKTIAEKRAACAEINRQKKIADDEKNLAEAEMIQYLQDQQLSSVKNEYGTARVAYRKGVKLPADDAAWDALFEHLKAVGDYDDLVGVNSASLNTWYNKKFEEAAATGNEDFQVPGLQEPTLTPILSFSQG